MVSHVATLVTITHGLDVGNVTFGVKTLQLGFSRFSWLDGNQRINQLGSGEQIVEATLRFGVFKVLRRLKEFVFEMAKDKNGFTGVSSGISQEEY